MAVTQQDCELIYRACMDNKVVLSVCHVMRYTTANIKIKQLVSSGIIGDVVNIQHCEPVGYFHFAHSFVRGNWRKNESTFSLLSKSCHDIDIIRYWMGSDVDCTAIHSFGSLNHFRMHLLKQLLSLVLTGGFESLLSHSLVFSAENARLNKCVVSLTQNSHPMNHHICTNN